LSELGFYHLTRTGIEEALARLLEKVLASGRRAVVRVTNEERLESLNRALWTYTPDSFLPHGTKADGFAAEQPVYLTTAVENPNDARVLVIIDAAPLDDLERYERCLELFDGHDAEAVQRARERWKAARAGGHTVTYWQQNERGGWLKGGAGGERQQPSPKQVSPL
jgi:DNA polymerase-3 subunit chi